MLPSAPLLQLILVSLLAHLALAGARITTSLYALSLGASTFTVGTLIGVFALFPMLLAVRAGRVVDQIGVVTPMVSGCIAMLIGCALSAAVEGLPVLYLAAALIGTGFMAIQVGAQHMVGSLSAADKRTANFSWLGLGFSVSGFCGPVLAGLLIDFTRFSVAFLAFSGFAAFALLLAVAGHRRGLGAQTRPSPASAGQTTGSALALLWDPRMRRIYIVGILLAAAWDLFTFVIPIHGARLGFAASTIGVILGCFSAATFLVRLAMPWLLRYVSEWQVLRAALALAALCYASVPFMENPLPMMAAAAILGIAVGSSQPNMLSLLHHVAPEGRAGEALGVRITMGNACQVILPLAFGAAGTALGLGVVFWLMSALIGAGIPIAWRQRPGRNNT